MSAAKIAEEPSGAVDMPEICRGGKGMILPFSKNEQDLSDDLRAAIYGVLLVWCFMGVAIVADTFMGAIEAITSRRKQITMRQTQKVVTVRVWNDTVANLTLMALGSSAPEILLSIIELFKNGMFTGELGASTIVGSASFNLMVIIGLCIVVIPDGEVRRIKGMSVFYITTVFSLFAYFWLVIVISFNTPEVVDVEEALLTFIMFPVLVLVSYAADVGFFASIYGSVAYRSARKWNSRDDIPEEVIQRACKILADHEAETMTLVAEALFENPHLGDLSDPTLADIQDLWESVKEARMASSQSWASRRQEATRWFTGGRKSRARPTSSCPQPAVETNTVQFSCSKQSLSANVKTKSLLVSRGGRTSETLEVEYAVHTFATKGSMMLAEDLPGPTTQTGTLVIKPDEDVKGLVVDVPRCPLGQPEDFEVRLTRVKVIIDEKPKTGLTSLQARLSYHPQETQESSDHKWSIGSVSSTKVFIVPPELRGKLMFSAERMTVQGTDAPQEIEAVVLRQEGCAGVVGCSYRTERLSAVPGYDYEEIEGQLTFEEGVTEQRVPLTILPKNVFEKSDDFLLVLEDAEGGAVFDPSHDGGDESSILTVTIMSLHNDKRLATKALTVLDHLVNCDEVRLGTSDWREQIVGAIYCNGSAEDQAEATVLDWVFHIIAFPWKLIFSLVPPTSYCNGWPCFWCALGVIALVTGVIGDVAELFGCVLEIPDAVTAITFVALGTSMPDLFASKTAATQDPTADASICNVTGSNSVNVFLGLGIPWTIGSLFWAFKESDPKWEAEYGALAATLNYKPVLVVRSANLGFSVLAFTCFSVGIIVILILRREFIGAELGGPRILKWMAAITFVLDWVCYTTLACWNAMVIQGKASESSRRSILVVLISIVVVAVVVTSICTILFGGRSRAKAITQVEPEENVEKALCEQDEKEKGEDLENSKLKDGDHAQAAADEDTIAPTEEDSPTAGVCVGLPSGPAGDDQDVAFPTSNNPELPSDTLMPKQPPRTPAVKLIGLACEEDDWTTWQSP
eukprot:TRINITY_DN12095_c0_g7_i1.p1 TRINITY_DN12095_c0_g7~~TRINITY_DN12095_c0_g7_i1.p1  ORF type:complete len:1028 (+),score=179.75 TRINITY_DN12095_c0_g7_i1:91-3174(+)